MEITYYGHSCFLIIIDNKKILIDPFITPNPLARDIDVTKIQPDYIFLSHGHNDHVADVEMIYKNSNAQLVSTYEVIGWFEKKGLENVHPMNHGGKWKFDFGTVKMVNAVHSSSMPDASYGGNPAGFVFETPGKTFYYAGDTALHMDMKLIAEDYKLDFAFLPIGDNFTMDINDAAKAANFVQVDTIIGMHYDTFPYIQIDHDKIKSTAKEKNKNLVLLKIGENITL
ncbi:MAG: metal-dependent hydrolase [Bacteroidota bacterium]|nr:metal-dependent hydrolase [Bacteroidota bacterium]